VNVVLGQTRHAGKAREFPWAVLMVAASDSVNHPSRSLPGARQIAKRQDK
jgi:hypothetical protein